MKLKIALAFVLSLSLLKLDGQMESDSLNPIRNTRPVAETGLLRPHWNFSVGSSYYYMPGFGSALTTSIRPSVTFPLNNKLSLQGGIITGRTYSSSIGLLENTYQPMGGYNSFALYGSATYQINEKMTIFGSGVKNLTEFPGNYPLRSYPPDYFNIGTQFKLGDNVTIGASFHMEERNPYYSPFGAFPFAY